MKLEQIKIDMESILNNHIEKLKFLKGNLESLSDFSSMQKADAELLISTLVQYGDTISVAKLYDRYFNNSKYNEKIMEMDNDIQLLRDDITNLMIF